MRPGGQIRSHSRTDVSSALNDREQRKVEPRPTPFRQDVFIFGGYENDKTV